MSQGMIDNTKRLKLREEARDFFLNCGAPAITKSQFQAGINTNTHTAKRILIEFEVYDLIIQELISPKGVRPIILWKPTKELKKFDLKEITKIEKPRRRTRR